MQKFLYVRQFSFGPVHSRSDISASAVRFWDMTGLIMLSKNILSDGLYKHPAPDDFFRTINNEAGEDLSWFWKEWFYNNWQLDLAVQSVSYINNDFKNGAEITVANLQKMAMPATVEIVFKDGSKQEIKLPVETWMQDAVHHIQLKTNQPLQSVVIDPAGLLPDSNRGNNVWKE